MKATTKLPEIIYSKREGGELRGEEIDAVIEGYVRGTIPDYQISALLMAIFFKGLSGGELQALTHAMMRSGEVFDWSKIEGHKADKHSTGGVGDKVSLILAPLAAACGLIVPMVAGRGLGHTGGTLDKLESIPGFDVNLGKAKIGKILSRVGAVIVGQSERFVPADKKLYALRDVTATVESIPLISASIMSKKLAEGCESLVLDIKVGNGAFMKNNRDARLLAETMIGLGRGIGRKVSALLTNMNQPTGRAVGNANEAIEAVDCLKGQWPADLKRITLALTGEMLMLGGIAADAQSAEILMEKNIENGRALEKFIAMVEAQGGDASFVDAPAKLKVAAQEGVIAAPREGWLVSFDTRGIGLAASVLGAGRQTKEDRIDHGVGIYVEAKTGEWVKKGQPIFTARYRKKPAWEECAARLARCVEIAEEKQRPTKTILEKISGA